MFEQSFKNIDNTLRKDAGVSNELDYVEQTSWILFLKYLNDLEEDKKTEAALSGKTYSYILADKYRWSSWAHPKTADGKLDHNTALAGDDLRDFVNNELFPYLAKFKNPDEDATTIEYKVGEIFSELRNKIQSGYVLREVLDIINGMRFRSQKEKHELSHLYETKIKNMGNAGRNGGEYYTPRPLIQAIVQVVDPKIGETVYDGAVGSAGFLVEAYEHMRQSKELTTQDFETLQKKTFYGKELKSLAYVIGTMNMILHGIETPNIRHTNTLAENINDIQEKDRYDIVLATPPFGGKIRSEIQHNFPIKSSETAYLFLQHFIKILRAGGRAGIVIKNTFLSNTDNASVSLRKMLLETCNLSAILDMPSGTFQGAGVKTVVLFFEKGASTKRIWYYQLNPGRSLGKTSPLNDRDMRDFIDQYREFSVSPRSWVVTVDEVNQSTFDLAVQNPSLSNEIINRNPEVILDEIMSLDAESSRVLQKIRKMI